MADGKPTENAWYRFQQARIYAKFLHTGDPSYRDTGFSELGEILAEMSQGLMELATASRAIYIRLEQVDAKLDALSAQNPALAATAKAGAAKARRTV